jgi:hypothetical protein
MVNIDKITKEITEWSEYPYASISNRNRYLRKIIIRYFRPDNQPTVTSKNYADILEFLKDRDYTSPTIIGQSVGGYVINAEYDSPYKQLRHSAWASPICLRMVKMGLLRRNKKGWYKRI